MHGPTDAVRREAARKSTLLARGAALTDVVGDAWTTLDAPGLVVLARGRLLAASDAHFQTDLLWSTFWKRTHDLPDAIARADRFVGDALSLPWSFAGVLSSQAYFIVRRADQQLGFAEAAARHWPALLSAGPRYSAGSGSGSALSSIPTLVQFCLARQGAPHDVLGALDTPTLSSILSALPGARVRALVAEGRVDEAAAEIPGTPDIVAISLASHLVEAGYVDAARAAVTSAGTPDPHGNVARWLAALGSAR